MTLAVDVSNQSYMVAFVIKRFRKMTGAALDVCAKQYPAIDKPQPLE
jgi:hypothetical protein